MDEACALQSDGLIISLCHRMGLAHIGLAGSVNGLITLTQRLFQR